MAGLREIGSRLVRSDTPRSIFIEPFLAFGIPLVVNAGRG
jgi:hypothetical protein